jgi:hypothetical protein
MSRSRAASTPRITEMSGGVLISRLEKEKEPVVIDLQQYAKEQSNSKSESASGVNKLKAINDFIRSNGRI